MAITAAAGTGGGLLVAVLRLSSEQLLGQAAGDAGRTLASLGSGAGFRTAAFDGIGGAATTLGAMVDDRTFGLAGLVILLLLPVGGPVWSGLVPPAVVLAGVRALSRSARRNTGRGVRAARNAPILHGADHGVVTLRILIVDDHDGFREVARRALVADGMEVVGTAASCAEALAASRELRPAVVLVDVHLGSESGFDVARRIAGAAPGPAVVLMSTRSEEELAEQVSGSGAAGFIPKQRLSADAIRAVLAECDT